MNIFIDTEFTDFKDAELISIGLVADDGRQFYGERCDFTTAACSDFVRQVVLPQLGKQPECVLTKAVLRAKVVAWLEQFQTLAPMICFDYIGDLELLVDLIGDFPAWLASEDVWKQIDELMIEQYCVDHNVSAHHALHDALANQYAFRRKAGESEFST